MVNEENGAADAAAAGKVGGAGGKLRSNRLSRRPATPYDRPPSRQRPSSSSQEDASNRLAIGGRGGWFSKLVSDPASRLLVGGANRLFSSVFSKRASALPQPQPGVIDGGKHEDLEACNHVQDRPADVEDANKEIKPGAASTSHGHAEGSDGNWFAEFEQLLKQKTISRDEFNRLSEFLRSRTTDLPEVDIQKNKNTTMIQRAELSLGKSDLPDVGIHKSENATMTQKVEPSQRKSDLISVDEKQKMLVNDGMDGSASTSLLPSHVLDDAYASPMEIAKAYMSRTSVYGPVSQNRVFNVERTTLVPKSLTSKVRRFSLAPKSPICWPGAMRQEDSGYFTPQSQRSSIGLHKMVTGEGTGIRTSQWEPSATTLTGGSQALKRRSHLAEDVFASVGPIRRVRQKSATMNSPRESSSFLLSGSTPLLTHSYTDRSSLQTYKEKTEDGAFESGILNFPAVDSKTEKSGVTSRCIPSESIDIGEKISIHLGRMFPSPKDKRLEYKASKAGEVAASMMMINTKSKEDHALDLKGKYFLSESPSPLVGQAAGVPESIWKGSNCLQTLPELAKAKENVGSSNGSILVSEPVSVGVVTGNSGLGARNQVNLDKHCFQSSTCEENNKFSHKGKQTSRLELTGMKTEAQAYCQLLGESADKTGEKISTSSADGSGFTFPVSPVPATVCEPPPTPTVTPMTIPSFSFGSNNVGKDLVFSFASASTSDVSTTIPQFNFGTEVRANISFSSAVAALASLSSSQSAAVLEHRERTKNEGTSSTIFSRLPEPTTALGSYTPNINQNPGSGSSAMVPSLLSRSGKSISFTPPLFQFGSFQSGSSMSFNNISQPGSMPTTSLFGSTKQTPPSSNPFGFGGSSVPTFSFSSSQHMSNSAVLNSKEGGSLDVASVPSSLANDQIGKEKSTTLTAIPAPWSVNSQSSLAPSSSGLGPSAVSVPGASIFQFSSPTSSIGRGLSEGGSTLASGDKTGRRFIKINRDKMRRR